MLLTKQLSLRKSGRGLGLSGTVGAGDRCDGLLPRGTTVVMIRQLWEAGVNNYHDNELDGYYICNVRFLRF